MKLYSIVLLVLCVIGCETQDEQVRREQAYNQQIKDQIFYYQDKKMKLCFAYWNLGERSGVFTNVPCTPEVLNWIAEDEEKRAASTNN